MHIWTLADQTWVEDYDGSAALLRQHAARAGVTAHIDLSAAEADVVDGGSPHVAVEPLGDVRLHPR
nr:hypothetical protein [Streptomyces cellulosae]